MKMSLKIAFYSAAMLAVIAPQSVRSQETLKVGFVATFSGGNGITGKHMLDGFNLALDHKDGKLGGLKTEILRHDDQLKPEIGLKAVRELVEKDKVNFVVGFGFSNILIAAAKPVLDAETFLISGNAGPVDFAKSRCSPYFFVASYPNPFKDESAGYYFKKKGYKRVYIMAPNYAAGREAMAGFKRTFDGEIIGEVYTRLDQVDYSAELSALRAAKPDAVYVFYPGGWGINFVKQWQQAGLRAEFPLVSKATVDETNLQAQGETAVGSLEAAHWNRDVDNPANKRFVADFIKKYGYVPSAFSQTSYDVALLIDSAVSAVKGNLSDKAGMRRALEKADIESPRGPFKFNTNHFPIQNVYMVKVVKRDDGTIGLQTEERLRENVTDTFAAECKMAQ